jgi:hypothetical protein
VCEASLRKKRNPTHYNPFTGAKTSWFALRFRDLKLHWQLPKTQPLDFEMNAQRRLDSPDLGGEISLAWVEMNFYLSKPPDRVTRSQLITALSRMAEEYIAKHKGFTKLLQVCDKHD